MIHSFLQESFLYLNFLTCFHCQKVRLGILRNSQNIHCFASWQLLEIASPTQNIYDSQDWRVVSGRELSGTLHKHDQKLAGLIRVLDGFCPYSAEGEKCVYRIQIGNTGFLFKSKWSYGRIAHLIDMRPFASCN